MTGNDCKLLEGNCKKLVNHFLKDTETWENASFLKLRQLHYLYDKFDDIVRDVRDHNNTAARVNSFQARSENFFQKMKQYGPAQCTAKLPYLHILRDHFHIQM